MLVAVFAAASFLSASLLFLVQPMAAKLLLPVFGGGPSIWNTSMVFFQLLLVGGYAYAHVVTTRLPRRAHIVAHVGILAAALLVLPFHIPALATGATGDPSLLLLGALTIMVGAPFFLLSTMAPILQRWFAWSDHPRAHDPYFLYAAGNAGSVLGLLSYPFLVEPLLDLRSQAVVWTAGYVLLAAVALSTAVLVVRFRPAFTPAHLQAPLASARPASMRIIRWGGWTFVPSSLMLATTAYITTDIAPVPLLWVVPLTVYLGTYIVAFSSIGPAAVRPAGIAASGLALFAGLDMLGAFALPTAVSVVVHVALLGAVGTAFHGHLVADRPPAEHLTRFYLAMSVGGALGGSFVALVAPLVFPALLEYGLLLVAVVVVLERKSRALAGGTPVTRVGSFALLLAVLVGGAALAYGMPGLTVPIVLAMVALGTLSRVRNVLAAAALIAALAMTSLGAMTSLHVERTFFGVHRVLASGDVHRLVHGSTVHGMQEMSPATRTTPLSYYHPEGPLGDIMRSARGTAPMDIGVVGLGTGALAAYGEPGDRIVFYEIDPAVHAIARNERLFTYLSDSHADIDVILGDGRLTLEAAEASHDVLVVDAFSSDAIPVHLLTREAIALYQQRTSPDGLVAVHISNRNLELAPVVAAIAEEDDIRAWMRTDEGSREDGRTGSQWIVLANEASMPDPPSGWQNLTATTETRVLWTDNHSDVLRIIRRGH